jgi:hypothetical protein
MNYSIYNAALEKEVLKITISDRFKKSFLISDIGYLRVWAACGRCGALSKIILENAKEKIELLRKNILRLIFMI